MDRVIKAADFAAKKHQDQRRKGPGEAPYINHPLGVANILINEGNTNWTRLFLHLLKSPGDLKQNGCQEIETISHKIFHVHTIDNELRDGSLRPISC